MKIGFKVKMMKLERKSSYLSLLRLNIDLSEKLNPEEKKAFHKYIDKIEKKAFHKYNVDK
jgi:hypothetical protein